MSQSIWSCSGQGGAAQAEMRQPESGGGRTGRGARTSLTRVTCSSLTHGVSTAPLGITHCSACLLSAPASDADGVGVDPLASSWKPLPIGLRVGALMAASPCWWPLSFVREGDEALENRPARVLGLMGRGGHPCVALTPLFEAYSGPCRSTVPGLSEPHEGCLALSGLQRVAGA